MAVSRVQFSETTMLATVRSATLSGIVGHPVQVEVHVASGLPGFTIVGLPDASCREARDRVRAAILSSDLTWPMRRITVNLAPGDVPKVGAGLDLPMAVGILVASEQIDAQSVQGLGMVGELGLDGSVRPVPGAFPLVDSVEAPVVVIATADARVASIVGSDRVRPVTDLKQVADVLAGRRCWPDPPPVDCSGDQPSQPDLADVKGQRAAKWALEVVAAGGHHMLLVGPPGAGKTMLARRLPGLLPDLTHQESIDATRIHSAAGCRLPDSGLIRRPPFRAPHHSASMAALVGGGSGRSRPGEVSLASNGVLFLDEVGEFAPSVLDALRQPLEEGVVRVARSGGSVEHPARLLLVAAMNPCPCGEGGSAACRCPASARARYSRRVSGPLLDRLDVMVQIGRPDPAALLGRGAEESSADVAKRVAFVRALAVERGAATNAELTEAQLEVHAPLSDEARTTIRDALVSGRLSGRGLRRVRCVARTIRDLDDAGTEIRECDVAAALSLRARPVMGGDHD